MELKALSIRQPWAWLIVNGFKDVENRSRRIRYRGPLLIHAGSSRSDLGEITKTERKHGVRIPEPCELEFGGIVGVVDVVDCGERHSSRWYDAGSLAWVLANPRRLPFREFSGALSLFRPDLSG